jgi:CDP-4-dehydro-6-deoxyglucose reductase, E1
MENKMFWPLMKDCITQEDKDSLVNFIQTSNRYTNGPKVKEFEKQWSEWLGVKHSLFVSSGSTANTLLLSAIVEKYNLKRGDKILVPTMTWVTNVAPVIQLGLEPIFCDVEPNTFSFDLEHLKKISEENIDIKVVFVTHLFGVPAPINEFKKIIPDAVYLEDCCESHGAEIYDKKVGTLSEGSTFSSYFGHHMTTVEGGFVSTDDTNLYELMKAKRSHGMARECSPEVFEQYKRDYPEVDERFMFVTDGYNLRNTEFGAVLGLSQLPRLDDMIKRRREICDNFVSILNKYDDVFHIPDFDGNSSFCLPFILNNKNMKKDLQDYLEDNGIETRPLCSGNLLRQPFLKDYSLDVDNPKVDYLHFNGFFIGNNHLITDDDINKLEGLLDEYFRIL